MHELEIQPRFCETDALGHISNTTLPIWLEAARFPFFTETLPAGSLKDWPLIMARIEIDFVQQLFVDDPVLVKTAVSRIGNSSFSVCQEVWQNDRVAAKASTVMVHFDFETQKPTPIPSVIREKLEGFLVE